MNRALSKRTEDFWGPLVAGSTCVSLAYPEAIRSRLTGPIGNRDWVLWLGPLGRPLRSYISRTMCELLQESKREVMPCLVM